MTARRVLKVLAGALLIAVSGGVLLLIASGFEHFGFVYFLGIVAYLFVALLGLDLLIQAVRGARWKTGFIPRAFGAGGRIRPAPVAIGLPIFLATALAVTTFSDDIDGANTARALCALWLAILANIACHELGHVTAARLTRLTLRRVLIGPLDFTLTDGQWHLGLSQAWFTLAGGMVIVTMNPRPTPKQLVIFAAGGPAGSLLVLVLTALLNPYPYVELLQVWRFGPALVLFLGLGALSTLVTNLVPNRKTAVGYPSDGFVIRANWKAMRG